MNSLTIKYSCFWCKGTKEMAYSEADIITTDRRRLVRKTCPHCGHLVTALLDVVKTE